MNRLLSAFKLPALFLSAVVLLPFAGIIEILLVAIVVRGVGLIKLAVLESVTWGIIFAAVIFTTVFAAVLVNRLSGGPESRLRVIFLAVGIGVACFGAGSSSAWDGSPYVVGVLLAGTIVCTFYRHSTGEERTGRASVSGILIGAAGVASIVYFLAALLSIGNYDKIYNECLERQETAQKEIVPLLKDPSSCSADADCTTVIRIGAQPCDAVVSNESAARLRQLDREIALGSANVFCEEKAKRKARMTLPIIGGVLGNQAERSFSSGNCSLSGGVPKCIEGKCVRVTVDRQPAL